MTQRTAQQRGDLTFTDADFQSIARYAADAYGLSIKIEKKGLIYARLARRIRALGMEDFKSYCAFATGPNPGAEKEELLSALTTNVSSFFRERHHFDMLRQSVLPALRDKVASGGQLRIWSAGCSAGQEPYSIAATVFEVWPDAGQCDIKIFASDVDPRILQKAKSATYRAGDADGLQPQQKQNLFGTVRNDAETVTVRQPLRDLVTFEQLNLISNWSLPYRCDIIFCRNVVIYFERTTQHRLWQRFSDALVPNGALYIGHSERLSGPAESHFKNVGITAFTKTAP